MKQKNRTIFEIVQKFLSPIKKTPLVYFKTLVVSLNWAIFGVIHIFFLDRIIYSLEIGNSELFNSTLLYYIGYIIFYEVAEWFMRFWGWTVIASQTINNVHGKYVSDYLKLDNNYVEKIGTGKSIALIDNGLRTWGRLMFLLIEKGAGLLVAIIFTFYMLVRVDVLYGVAFLFLYIFFHTISFYLNKGMLKYRRKRVDAVNEYTKNMVRIIMSKFEIVQSDKLDREIKVLDKYNDEEIYYNWKMVPYVHFFFRLPEAGIIVLLIFFFHYLGNQILMGEASISVLVGLSGALIIMQKALKESILFYKDITKEFSIIEKMWDFFENSPKAKGHGKGKKFLFKFGEVEFKKVSYAYTENKSVFKDFDLKINGGKVTALVGNSGGGKSTLVKLVSGYIAANTGEVLIDGQKLSETNLKSYYKDIGYLTQEPSVFDGTVYDNLTYAIDRKLKDGEIDEVLKQAKCEFIHDLQDGINTEIGERGIRLSGGQKQRLAIAKIYLKNPKIIILDEPTSALDSFSEEKITKAMKNLFKGRTVIVIAHRLQTVKHADDIIFLDNGKIIERGTHDDLVAKKGNYKRMLDLQSGF